jgi:hypothetical protein
MSLIEATPDRFAPPTREVWHLTERGINDRAGQWAVIKVERWRRANGDIAAVNRTVVVWLPGRALADGAAAARNAGIDSSQ